ncbi:MAG TPA: hypothetical protein VGM23_05140 [Armatimonadota bacterium]
MANCPRCGAENQPGRASCWNCWASLPATPAAEAAAAAPAADEARQIPLQSPSLPLPAHPSVPEPPRPAAHTGVTIWAGAPQETLDSAPIEREHRGSGWAWGIMAALAMVVLAIILLWHYTFHPQAAAHDFSAVAQAYVTALAVRDTQAQQQLATEGSKGLLLPDWLTVANGSVQPSPGKAGSVRVDLTLTPAPMRGELLPPKVATAISRPYTVALRLQQEPGGWRVDQRAFLASLKEALIGGNPGVEFPKWE